MIMRISKIKYLLAMSAIFCFLGGLMVFADELQDSSSVEQSVDALSENNEKETVLETAILSESAGQIPILKASPVYSDTGWVIDSDGMLTILTDDAAKDHTWTNDDSKKNAIRTVSFNKNVSTIYGCEFYECTSLSSITIPKTVSTIEKDYLFRGAFRGCASLKKVIFEEGSALTSIGDYSFYGCSSLEEISFPDGLKTIGEYAFTENTALKTVVFSDSITSIGQNAFCDCSSIEGIAFGAELTSLGDDAFRGCTSLKELKTDSKLSSIPERGFYDCNKLQSAELASGITTIGKGAFNGCTGLKSIKIPDSCKR